MFVSEQGLEIIAGYSHYHITMGYGAPRKSFDNREDALMFLKRENPEFYELVLKKASIKGVI